MDKGDTGMSTVPFVPVANGDLVPEPVDDLLGLEEVERVTLAFCEALLVLVTETDREVERV